MIARDNHGANQLEADLQTLLGGDPSLPVVAFPDWETLPYDRFSPHPDIISQRLAALHRLPALKRGLVIVPVQTLLQQLAPRSYVIGGSFDLKVGQRLDLEAEKRRLESAGYRNVPQVMDPGDFAVRGGLLDVYPMGADEPLRVELLDEDIDSIRAFDPESQRSLDRVEAVHMLPGREVPMDEASVARVLATLRERFDVDTRRSALYQDLKSGLAPAGVEYYLPLFFERTATLFDYLPADALLVIDESHVTIPQIGAMFKGDRSRKETLVEFGFRLPSALDNRPLRFEEWEERCPRAIYVSATPGPYEYREAGDEITELVVRPTGLVDPEVEIRLFEVPLSKQIKGLHDDLYDVGFSMANEVGDGIVAESVWDDPPMVALPERHPLLTFKRVPLGEVLHYPLVLCDPQVCEGCSRQRERLLRTVDAQPTVAEYVKTYSLMLALVAAGYGVGFSSAARLAGCHQADVVVRPLADETASLTTYLLRPEGEIMEPLRQFIDRVERVGRPQGTDQRPM